MPTSKKETKKRKTQMPVQNLCQQCGEHPPMYSFNGQNICLNCYERVHYMEQLNQARLIEMSNQAKGEMAETLGFAPLGSTPPIRNIVPVPPARRVTLTNFHFEKSNIGSINTGTIRHLDSALMVMRQTNQENISTELQTLTEAVVNNNEIIKETKDEVLEYLAFLAEQATKLPQERSPVIGRDLIGRVQLILQTVTSVVALWDRIVPYMEKLFT